MKKTLLVFVLSMALMLLLSACENMRPTATETPATETPAAEPQDAGIAAEVQAPSVMTAFRADGSAVILEDCGDGTWKDANGPLYYLGEDGVLRARGAEDLYTQVPPVEEKEVVRQDGERFETVITIEGMEETVRYEHIRNDALGFEMDYDYETFVRQSEPDRERFVSVYDDPQNPENYLEVMYNAENADTVAAFVRTALSREYDLFENSRELERAGSSIRIEASEIKGTNQMPDMLQIAYIIPTSDGCRIAMEHLAIESSEGFGRRFSYMLNTLSVIDRNGERKLSDEQALSAIKNYCYARNPDLEGIANQGEYPVHWEISASDARGIVVLFRSYTGAQIRYYIDRITGDTSVTEFVPGITPEEQRTEESLNAWEYLS